MPLSPFRQEAERHLRTQPALQDELRARGALEAFLADVERRAEELYDRLRTTRLREDPLPEAYLERVRAEETLHQELVSEVIRTILLEQT